MILQCLLKRHLISLFCVEDHTEDLDVVVMKAAMNGLFSCLSFTVEHLHPSLEGYMDAYTKFKG